MLIQVFLFFSPNRYYIIWLFSYTIQSHLRVLLVSLCGTWWQIVYCKEHDKWDSQTFTSYNGKPCWLTFDRLGSCFRSLSNPLQEILDALFKHDNTNISKSNTELQHNLSDNMRTYDTLSKIINCRLGKQITHQQRWVFQQNQNCNNEWYDRLWGCGDISGNAFQIVIMLIYYAIYIGNINLDHPTISMTDKTFVCYILFRLTL